MVLQTAISGTKADLIIRIRPAFQGSPGSQRAQGGRAHGTPLRKECDCIVAYR